MPEREVKRDAYSVEVLLEMGEERFGSGQLNEAREIFEKVLSLDPRNSDALNNLGVVIAQTGDYNITYEFFKKALEMNPENNEARQNLEMWQNRMKEEWNERAADDALYYVHNTRRQQTEEEFNSSGKNDVELLIVKDLQTITRGKGSKSMNMLEIGCGAGRMTKHMADIFGQVHGIDVSEEMIKIATDRLNMLSNVFLYEGNGKDLSMFQDESFDFVFSFIVLQHIPFKDVVMNYIREAHRVLRQGSVFKFQVQGYAEPEWINEPKNTWHGAIITEDDIDHVSKELGFEITAKSGQGTQYSWYTLIKKRPRIKWKYIQNRK